MERWAGYRQTDDDGASGRAWWDAHTRRYLAEHGTFLGPADFVWCPEGLREADVRLLGDVAGREVVEVGCGAAQCSRWLAGQGASPVGVDLSAEMLAASARYDTELGTRVPVVQGDARALPLADAVVDLAFSAFGALPFVPDVTDVHHEVARVLRPGGRWVFAVTHPVRWAFPDDPSERGLTATRSYFDRTPYVETDDDGVVEYAEFHATLGDQVRALRAAGFVLDDLVEPEWPEGHERIWGGWGPVRGAVLPGSAIFVTHLVG